MAAVMGVLPILANVRDDVLPKLAPIPREGADHEKLVPRRQCQLGTSDVDLGYLTERAA